MTTIFNFSKASDFPNDQVSLTVLANEIDAGSAGLAGKLFDIGSLGDTVTITFSSDLTGSEETELNDIVSGDGGIEEEESIILGYDTSMLTILVDEDGYYTYIGEAVPGVATSQSKWRISRLDESGSGALELVKTFANNTTVFDKIWDSRLSYNYDP